MFKTKIKIFVVATALQLIFLFLIFHRAENPPYLVLWYNHYVGDKYILLRLILLTILYILIPTYIIYSLLIRKGYQAVLLYFTLLLSIIIAKNFYVYYFIYEDVEKNRYAFNRMKDNNWQAEYITTTDTGKDFKVQKRIDFTTDTSGIYEERYFYEKLDGLPSRFSLKNPSFRSMLPFGSNPMHSSKYQFKLLDGFFVILSLSYESDRFSDFAYSYYRHDTYHKYKISGDTLQLDVNPENGFYEREPVFKEKSPIWLSEEKSNFPWHLLEFWQ